MNKLGGYFLVVVGAIGLAGTILLTFAMFFAMAFCGSAPNGLAQCWNSAGPILGAIFMVGLVALILLFSGIGLLILK
ncbi:MAG: hypothetical protein U7123_15555 [Potamolinea sp.]